MSFRRSLPIVLGLLLAVPTGAEWLLLRDGTRVETTGPWELRGRVVVFRQPNGTLASIRASEVDFEASGASRLAPVTVAEEEQEPAVGSSTDSPLEPSEPASAAPTEPVALASPEVAGPFPAQSVSPAPPVAQQVPPPGPASASAARPAAPAADTDRPALTAVPAASTAPSEPAEQTPEVGAEPPPAVRSPSTGIPDSSAPILADDPHATSPRPVPLDGALLEIDERPPARVLEDGGARVVDWRAAQRPAGGLSISGRLAGPSSGTATDLALTVRLVDRNGVPLAAEPAQLSTRRLDPGQEALFRARFTGTVRYQRVEFDVHSLVVAVAESP